MNLGKVVGAVWDACQEELDYSRKARAAGVSKRMLVVWGWRFGEPTLGTENIVVPVSIVVTHKKDAPAYTGGIGSRVPVAGMLCGQASQDTYLLER